MNRTTLRYFRTSLLALSAISALPLLTAPASAQQAPANSGQAVETVVVTAERRSTDVQTTPISVSVLSGDDLAKKSVNMIDQLMFATPSLTIDNFGQGNEFNIRGLGKGENNVQTPSGVTTYINGAPIPATFFQDFPLYDISSVEVLRGPQGTFAGENATAGALFITTTKPTFDNYTGYAQAQVGNYADALVQGAVNIPISDDFAIRIAGYGERRDSFWSITGPHAGNPGSLLEGAGRFEALWQPTQAFEAYFYAEYINVNRGGYPADPQSASCSVAPPFVCQANKSDPLKITDQNGNKGLEYGERAVLDLRYTFENGISLRSVSSYQSASGAELADLSGTDIPAYNNFIFYDHGEEKVISEELNLVSPSDQPLTWILGAFFQHDHVDLPENGGFDIGAPAGGEDITLTYHTPKQHEAVFGQVTYDVTQALQLQFGLRYNHSSFDLQDREDINLNFGPPIGEIPVLTFVAPCATPPVLPCTNTTHQSDSALTGKFDINYKLDAANFLYAFIATGHKDGALNTTPEIVTPGFPPAVIKPERLIDYEAGWKSSLFNEHFKTTLDGFYNDYNDFQLTLESAPGQNAIFNAKHATVYGFEAQGDAVFGALSFDFSAAYIHGEFGADSLKDSRFDIPVNIAGRQMAYSPHATFNAGIQYAFDLENGDYLIPRVDYAFVDSQEASVFAVPGLDGLEARNILNAQLTFAMQDNWMIQAYATNLNNDHYVTAFSAGLGLVPGSSPNLRDAAPPRQFGLRVTKNF